MTDIFIGFGKVLRIRFLRQHPTRRSLFLNPKVETLSAKVVRHDNALELLEERKVARLGGEDVTGHDRRIRGMGFEFEDEPSREDGAYSYWRVR